MQHSAAKIKHYLAGDEDGGLDWHIDISYINICGTFYYLCSILDGFSRSIVHWEIREAMKESDVEIIISGMTHVKTSPYYPQSNGKLERYHRTIKGTCIRVHNPLSVDEAIRLVTDFVDHYNTRRLHSSIGYIGAC